MPEESDQGNRLARGERAKRYREQAGRLLELAEMEAQPRARDRLVELALQYGDLAGRVAGQHRQSAMPPRSADMRDRSS